MTACLCKEDVDALAGFVCFCSSTIGVELGLASGTVIPFAAGCISPTAVDTLLVNDEMAHPVQDAASLGCVVFILAEEEVVESAALGGVGQYLAMSIHTFGLVVSMHRSSY